MNADRPRTHCPLLHVGPRNLATPSIQLDNPVPRVAHTHEATGFKGESEPPLRPLPALHTYCPGEGHTYRRPCPSTGEGHGVDVDGRLLLQAGPRNLATLSIQLDIQVPRVAHTHEAPGFEDESEPPLRPLPALHTYCPGEGHTYRRPCPLTGEGHGVDVDCRLLLRAGPRYLATLSIQLDIPVPRLAHTHLAPGFEGKSEPPPPRQEIGPRPSPDWRSARSARNTF